MALATTTWEQRDEEGHMYGVVRSYSGQGAAELFDLLAERHEEIRDLFTSGVPGFVSYTAVRTGDDTGVTVTVCQDKAGTDESSRLAREWVAANLSTSGNPPVVTEGGTVLYFGS